MPLFSIIIPTFNRSADLRRSLESLCQQTCSDFEVLVCDDGSTDDSAQVANEFATRLDLKYLWAENWGGPARPRNRGIAASTGAWLCFLDSDDWWYPHKLQACLPLLNDADLLHHAMDLVGPEGGLGRLDSRNLQAPVVRDLLLHGNNCGIINSSVVVRRELVIAANGFSEDRSLIAVEDFDLWIRISLLTDRFECLSGRLGAYWKGPVGANISYSEKQFPREIAVYQRHIHLLSQAEQRHVWARIYWSHGRIHQKARRFLAARASFAQALLYSRFSARPRIGLAWLLCFLGVAV